MGDQFVLQRMIDSCFSIISYLCPFLGEEAAGDALAIFMKEICYTLTRKALKEEENCQRQPHLQRNFLCMFEALHSSIRHQ